MLWQNYKIGENVLGNLIYPLTDVENAESLKIFQYPLKDCPLPDELNVVYSSINFDPKRITCTFRDACLISCSTHFIPKALCMQEGQTSD